MSDILVIQNSKIETLGNLKYFFESDGFNLQTILATNEKIPQDNFLALIVLGGPESANEKFDYLKNEMNLIKKFTEQKKPVLGICLGSQLIAKTFGAKVFPGPKKEIGFYNDLQINNNSRLFEGFQNPFTVFHWHSDTFNLPIGAQRLVSSTNYENQAFQINNTIGIQFHLEVTIEMIKLWFDKTHEKLENISYINPKKILQDIDTDFQTVQKNLEIFYNNFKNSFKL